MEFSQLDCWSGLEMTPHNESPSLHQPAEYHIVIEGKLDREWSDYLQGMTIETEGSRGQPSVTTLAGQLVDQAALLGVLNALYDLGMALLSVQRLSGIEEIAAKSS